MEDVPVGAKAYSRFGVDGEIDGKLVFTIGPAVVGAANGDGHDLTGGRCINPVAADKRAGPGHNLAGIEIAVDVAAAYRQADLRRGALEEGGIVRDITDRSVIEGYGYK